MQTEERKNLRVIGLLSLSEGKEEALGLVEYMATSQQQALKNILEKYGDGSAETNLQALAAGDDFFGLPEIHPGWLLALLKEESPRVIGVVLRHLPSKQVRFLLEHLPKRLTMKLPNLIEAFYVPTELLGVVRRRLEKHFVSFRNARQTTPSDFEQIYNLKLEELEALFYDLGLSELALSLIDSARPMLKVVLNRFAICDAKQILKRVKQFQEEAGWFLKDARYSVFQVGQEEIGPSRFLSELGLVSVAKSLRPEDETSFLVLRQKMAPEKAHLFKRYWEEVRTNAGVEKVTKRKTWILDHCNRLNEEKNER